MLSRKIDIPHLQKGKIPGFRWPFHRDARKIASVILLKGLRSDALCLAEPIAILLNSTATDPTSVNSRVSHGTRFIIHLWQGYDV